MDKSYALVIWLLLILGAFVMVGTNFWRKWGSEMTLFRPRKLTGQGAYIPSVYLRAVLVGILVAFLLRANLFEMLMNPEDPAAFFGLFHSEIREEGLSGLYYEVFGILITGVTLAFVSKLLNDLLDIVYEVKLLLRRLIQSPAPEDPPSDEAAVHE